MAAIYATTPLRRWGTISGGKPSRPSGGGSFCPVLVERWPTSPGKDQRHLLIASMGMSIVIENLSSSLQDGGVWALPPSSCRPCERLRPRRPALSTSFPELAILFLSGLRSFIQDRVGPGHKNSILRPQDGSGPYRVQRKQAHLHRLFRCRSPLPGWDIPSPTLHLYPQLGLITSRLSLLQSSLGWGACWRGGRQSDPGSGRCSLPGSYRAR